jgi:hypothetical protein
MFLNSAEFHLPALPIVDCCAIVDKWRCRQVKCAKNASGKAKSFKMRF